MSEAGSPSGGGGTPAVVAPNASDTGANPNAQGADVIPENPLVWDPAAKAYVAKQKIDGQERVTKWEDLHRDAQTAAAAQERFEKAKAIARENAEIKRQAQMYREALENPARAYDLWNANGIDPNVMLEHLQRHAQSEASLTPEQRELREYRARQAAYEQQEQARFAAEREAAEEAAEAAQNAKYERAFATRMTEVGIPAEATEVRELVNYILFAMHDEATEKGQKIQLREAVVHAKEKVMSIARSTFAMLPAEERAALLGPDLIAELGSLGLTRAARIPEAVPHHSTTQPRRGDGKFNRFTTFRPGSSSSFGRALGDE